MKFGIQKRSATGTPRPRAIHRWVCMCHRHHTESPNAHAADDICTPASSIASLAPSPSKAVAPALSATCVAPDTPCIPPTICNATRPTHIIRTTAKKAEQRHEDKRVNDVVFEVEDLFDEGAEGGDLLEERGKAAEDGLDDERDEADEGRDEEPLAEAGL